MRFAIVDMKSKLCVGVFTSLDSYENGAVFENNTYIQLDGYVEDDKFFLNSYYKNNEFKQLAVRPSQYHIWNLETEQWQEPGNYQQLLFNEAASKVKQERQRLLTATDWTDTVSASTRLENYNAWQFYRQQLRDITTQEGYPFNVEWPAQPV
jgi:hypothetical protein